MSSITRSRLTIDATSGSLTGVTVSDPLITDLAFAGGDLDGDSQLDPDEIWTYTGSYTVTQDDLDSNGTLEPNNVQAGFIDNIATASSNETDPTRPTAPRYRWSRTRRYAIDKSASVPGGTADVGGRSDQLQRLT